MKLILLIITSLMFSSAFAKDEWLSEEILKKLYEMHTELKLVREELTDIRKDLDTVKKRVLLQDEKLLIKTDGGLNNGSTLGAKDAPLVMVEFFDFQCPYCKVYYKNTFPEIKKEYIDTGKLKYVMRDYPLDFHAEAESAAIAANCAGQQGEYWSMHDKLFKERVLNETLFLSHAEEKNLDMAQFKNCLNDDAIKRKIAADIKYGEDVGITGTPGFIVAKLVDGKFTNIRKITGAQDYRVFKRVFESVNK